MAKLTSRVNFFRTAPIKAKTRNIISRIAKFVELRPLTVFFTTLAILFGLIFLGNNLRKQEIEPIVETPSKLVETFKIGSTPQVSYQARIEKAGVVNIVAQTGGIITKVNVKEGKAVHRGQTLVNIASNYLGGNTASIQRNLASVQNKHIVDTFDLQKETINKQREIASKTHNNSQDLRRIAGDSANDTKSLIELNDNILSELDTTIANLESTNIGGINDDLINQTKQLKSQFLAGNNQAKASLRNLELAGDKEKSPSQLNDLQKDLALKQLDLQEKSLELSRETSALQLKLAQVGESIMFPASPFEGTVEKVHVKKGQFVQPGTTLITIAGSNNSTTATAYVPIKTARKVSLIEDSTIYAGDQTFKSTPDFISSEAVSGTLYSIIYSIPSEYSAQIANQSYINIDIPLGVKDASTVILFIPLDAVHQTQEKSIVYLAQNNIAQSREVYLGEVLGDYIEITSGLSESDSIIITRNVTDGDKIEVQTF